jgi:hypothetical protein
MSGVLSDMEMSAWLLGHTDYAGMRKIIKKMRGKT